MTPPYFLAVFTALALIVTPLQVFASEDELAFTNTSSTVIVELPIQEASSSTELSLPPILELVTTTTLSDLTTTSTSSVDLTATSSSTFATSSIPSAAPVLSESPDTVVPPSTTGTICLAIIAPYPIEGPEWIAFYGLTPSSSHRLMQWSIYDAQSSLTKIVTSTPLLWDDESHTLRFQLRSARLNNDGDTVTLKNPLGETHDTFTYTQVDRDQRWFRERCDTPWRIIPEPIVQYVNDTSTSNASPSDPSPTIGTSDLEPAPPTMNISPATIPPSTPIIIEEERTVSLPVPDPEPVPIIREEKPPAGTIAVAQMTTPAATITPSSPTKLPSKLPTTKNTSNNPQNTSAILPVPKTKTSAKKSSTTKPRNSSANTTKKTTKAPLLSLSMSTILDQPAEYQGIRVRITGTVASRQKFIGTHKFVLLNSEGKGLLVHAKTTAPTPDRGQYVQLTGVIMWNDEGVWLKQQAQDHWEALERSNEEDVTELALHTAALDAPGQEDAWSHIEVEGKVVEVQAGSFDLETEDGIPLRIRLPKLLRYRAGRLDTLDTVRVRGLLDTRGTEPVLLPQVIEDIQVLERAPLPAPKDTRPAQAPWLPVGIIAGTLASSETLRRAKTWYKKHQEERAFASFLQTNPQNTH